MRRTDSLFEAFTKAELRARSARHQRCIVVRCSVEHSARGTFSDALQIRTKSEHCHDLRATWPLTPTVLKLPANVEFGLMYEGFGLMQLQEGLAPVPIHTGLSPGRDLRGVVAP